MSPTVSRDRLLIAGRYCVPLILIGALALLLAGQDVSLADGNFILSYTHRILNGEIPHADFVSLRPAGSPIFHLIDYALPMPLLISSRVVTITEFVALSFALGLLLVDRPLREASIAALGLFCATTVVNLHVFPVFAWHTVDGLMFSALGFLALQRSRCERTWLVVVGFLLLGAAPLMKQSFALAPILGLLYVGIPWVTAKRLDAWRSFAPALAAVLAPGFLYLLVVALGGGLGEMHRELTGATVVKGEPLIDVFKHGVAGRGTLLALIVGSTALYAPIAFKARLPKSLARPLPLAAAMTLTGLVVWVALADDLQFLGAWQFRLFWMAVGVAVISSIARRSLDWPAVLIVALGWMVTLSYGAARPALVGGSLAAVVLVRAWENSSSDLDRLHLRHIASASALILAGITLWQFADIRSRAVYLPARSNSILQTDLGDIAPALRGIRSDSATAEYLRAVRSCVDRYPAKWTAILPEDALSATVFDLRNPFPMDWLWPAEYASEGSRLRIVDAARKLGREGDFLVLVPIIPQYELVATPPPHLPTAKREQTPPPFPYDGALAGEIFGSLGGRAVSCGPFVGSYRPGRD